MYYVKADKGNSIIIMDKRDYDNRMIEHIESGNYNKVKRNPLSRMVKSTKLVVKDILKVFINDDGSVNKKLKWKLSVPNSMVPKLYGLPKIHKVGPLKMRPVVSNVNSPNYKLAKWFIAELKCLPEPEGFSIKNSLEFASKVGDLVLEDDEIMISFDVESLFPNVPVDEGLEALDEWLTKCGVDEKKKQVYISAAKVCLDDSFFQFRDVFYKLLQGTSMGNPISPLIANLVMCKLEMSLKTRNLLPRWWHRYIDDVFAVIKRSALKDILLLLNSQHEFPTIKFTAVPEVDGKLEFLDLQLIRKSNKVEVAVFHKPTSTKRLIPSTSHCPIQHKMAAFHSMAHRISCLPLSVQNYKKEYDYMVDSAIVNGYEKSMIDRIIKKHADKIRKSNSSTLFSQSKLNDEVKRVRVTYAPRVTNKLKSTFRNKKMEMVYSTQNKLCMMLGNTKDRTLKENKSGIYEITCMCSCKYFGQSRRQLRIRFKEHLSAIRLNQPNKSAVADHALSSLHLNLSDFNLNVKKVVVNPTLLDAYESFYIHKHYQLNPNERLLNTDLGNISSCLFNCV